MHYHWVWEIDYLSGKETCPNNNKIKEAKFIFSPQLIEHLKDKKLKSKKKEQVETLQSFDLICRKSNEFKSIKDVLSQDKVSNEAEDELWKTQRNRTWNQ